MQVSDFIQQAQQQGISSDQINAYIQSKPQGFFDAPNTPTSTNMPTDTSGGTQGATIAPADNTTPQAPSNNGGFWQGLGDFAKNNLSTIGAIGLPAAADVLTGGLAIPADMALSAAGGGLGETVKELLNGQGLNPGNISEQSVLGGIGTGIGGAASKIIGKVLPDIGMKTAVNGLNFTPKMLSDYFNTYGESAAKTLMDNGLAGAGKDGLDMGINKIQGQFDKIANSSTPANQDIFLNNAVDVLNKLKSSSVPSVKAIASKVDEALTNITNKWAGGDISNIGDLNSERKAFDAATSDSQFKSDNWGVNRTVGGILRKSVQQMSDAAGLTGNNGQTLTQIGSTLNKLYDLSDTAAGRTLSGGGGSPFSLTNLVFGGEVGAAANAMGFNPLAGGIGGVVLRKMISNPAVAGALSKSLPAIGNAVSGRVGNLISQGVGATGATLLPNIVANSSNNTNNTPENNSTNNHINSNIILQDGTKVNTDANGNVIVPPPDQFKSKLPVIYSAEQANADAQKTNNPYDLQRISDAYNRSQTNAQQYQLPPAEQSDLRDFTSTTLPEMMQLGKFIGEGKTGMLNDLIKGVNYGRHQTDPDYAVMSNLINQLKGLQARGVAGGTLRSFELQFLNTLPNVGDQPKIAQAEYRNALTNMLNTYVAKAPYYAVPSGLSSGQSLMPNLPAQQQQDTRPLWMPNITQ